MQTAIIFTIAFIMLGCLAIEHYYLIRRSGQVYNLQSQINAACYKWSVENLDKQDAWAWAYRTMPDYNKMVFSFKPVKAESFLTKEHIKKLGL